MTKRKHFTVVTVTPIAEVVINRRKALKVNLLGTPARTKIEFRLHSVTPNGDVAGLGTRILSLPVSTADALMSAIAAATLPRKEHGDV